MGSKPPTAPASPSADTPQPAPQSHPGYPYHEYLPTRVEPCAILNVNDKPGPFHLLACGHLVAIDCEDTRCGLNCLHAATWMTQKISQQDEDSIDLLPGKTLFQAVTFSATRPHHPIKPPQSSTQGHDKLFCEICYGLPISSYNIVNPGHGYRRALCLTRPVISHFTGFTDEITEYFLAELFYNPQSKGFDHKFTHYLRCGHEVWSAPFRPCASNCNDMPPCRGRIFPRNVKQGDAILCKECTYRAELVYSRYVTAGRGVAHDEVARDGLQDSAGHHGPDHSAEYHQHHSHGQVDQKAFDGSTTFGD
ncbi:hypothetical protein K458DRAFT_487813 [Lentithecium fluviatile CBS 122367]|uniref:Uncharacterized protein n=1 Tax=Lentithecium fluviatile CBS 122367 TaxID=1168545 RepID=A0A6G1J0H2_9PLEO|nr:hypothetical protein K458DRAFT_487813 [Lentithecium fluviatile CBS 122367]